MKVRFALAFAIFAFANPTIAPIGAMAQTQEEQDACMGDVFNICGHAIPDRDRVISCLVANAGRVSGECRAVMQRYSRSATRAQQASTR
jgi:hypothetical protein